MRQSQTTDGDGLPHPLVPERNVLFRARGFKLVQNRAEVAGFAGVLVRMRR